MKVGKSSFGGKKQNFKIKDGDNVFRILPPLGELADQGRWSVYYAIQWGFKDSKGNQRPFEDCRVINPKSKMVEVESPAYLLREKLQNEKDQLVEKFKAGDLTKEQLQEQVKPVNEKIKRFNLDAKHYLNVVNLDGEIGILKINNTLMKALRAAMKEKIDTGVDPTSVEHGVYFNFKRTNETKKLQDYVFSVAPYLPKQSDGSYREEIHVMDDIFMNRLSSEASDLSKLYTKPTPEQIQRMIDTGATGDGSPVVDEVLGSKDSNASSSSDDTETEASSTTSETKVETKTETESAPETETKVETKSEESSSSNSKDSDEDEFLKSIGAL